MEVDKVVAEVDKYHWIDWLSVIVSCIDLMYWTTGFVLLVRNCDHDEVIRWKCFPRYWNFVWRIHQSPVHTSAPFCYKMVHCRIWDWCIVGVVHRSTLLEDPMSVSLIMMTSSNGNIFRVTGHLCGEFTGPQWISHAKASDAELWCFLWSATE